MKLRSKLSLIAAAAVVSHAGLAGAQVIPAMLTGYTVVHQFTGYDGSSPRSGLIASADGNFYGTTFSGGVYGKGTVFAMTPAGVITTLYNFSGTDGSGPTGVIELPTGELAGVTYAGGSSSAGVAFKVTKGGSMTVLHSLNGTTEGNSFAGTLVRASDGNLYGATSYAGSNACGTVVRVTTAGVFTVLANFTGATHGCSGKGTLLQAPDGYLYGTAEGAGASGFGTVYKVSTSGALSTVITFNGANGKVPKDGLSQNAGYLFGVTYAGGTGACSSTGGCGTVFRFTTSGVFQSLHQFSDQTAPTGAYPHGPLLATADGVLRGVTEGGGYVQGTTYQMTQAGLQYSITHNFVSPTGSMPSGSLVRLGNGGLYGVTPGGSGNSYNGVVFGLPFNGTGY